MSGDDGHTDSYFLPEDDLVYVDDGLVAVFEHVLDFDYQPRPAIPGVQSIVSKAHSANFKLALHEAVSTFSGSINVLVVGAGRGNDIRRCLNAYPSIDHFTLIEPSEARLDIAKNVCQEFGVPCLSLCGTFREVYCHVSDRKFDLIVMNMSFQHIAGDNRLYGDLSTNLSHQGVIIGTFFNHDLFFVNQKQISEATGATISVSAILDLERKTEFSVAGVRLVNVCGVSFFDNYITPEVIDGFCNYHQLAYSIYDGKSLLVRSPSTLQTRFKAPMAHPCSSVITTVVCRPRRPGPIPRLCSGDTIESYPSPKILPMKCLSYKDIPFFRAGNYFVAEKRNGIAVVLSFLPGCIRVVHPLEPDKLIHTDMELGNIYHVHAELVDTTYWFLDCLSESFTSDMPFIFRYRVLQSLSRICQSMGFDMPVNPHVPVRGLADLFQIEVMQRERERSGKSFEGVVLVPMAGSVFKGYSPTRRLKLKKTIDIVDPDGDVSEYILEGASQIFVKKRPEKKGNPNPPNALKEIKDSVPFDEGLTLLRGEANASFSWDLFDLPDTAFIHVTNEAVKLKHWVYLYRTRASWPIQKHHEFLRGLFSYMRTVVIPPPEFDKDQQVADDLVLAAASLSLVPRTLRIRDEY